MDEDNNGGYAQESISPNLVVMILRKLDAVSSITTQTTASVARIEERLGAVTSLANSITGQAQDLSRIASSVERLNVRADSQQKEIDCLVDDGRWARRMISGTLVAAVLSLLASIIVFFVTK